MADDLDISITINGARHRVLCGKCKAPIGFVGEPDIETGDAGCVRCDNVTKVQEVAHIALQYAKDEMQMIVNRSARDVARKSKLMTFSGKTVHDKVYRFIVQL